MRICLIVVGAAVVAIVLSPVRPAGNSQDWLKVWIESAHAVWLPEFLTFAFVEWLANVVMFVPLGLLSMLLTRRWWIVVPALLVASVAIEMAQSILLPGRVGSVLDVIANLLGAVAGSGIGIAVLSIGARRRGHLPSRASRP